MKWIFVLFFLTFTACSGKSLQNYSERSTLFENDREFLGEFTDLSFSPLKVSKNGALDWQVPQEVLNKLSQKIENFSERNNRSEKYQVSILNLPQPNAFAAPDGRVYVTTGMLALLDSEEELAGVLAHEIGHVEMKHYEQRMNRIGVDIILGILSFVFSQNEELEADQFGFKLMQKAGYSGEGMQTFFQRLHAFEKRSSVSLGGFMSSHPATESRWSKIGTMLKEKHLVKKPSSSSFMKLKKTNDALEELYSPKYRNHFHPSRLKNKNPSFDKLLKKSVSNLEANLDLSIALDALSKLADQKGDSRENFAARYWRALAELEVGKASDFRKTLVTLLQKENEDGLAPLLPLISVYDGDIANETFEKLKALPSCKADFECSYYLAKTAPQFETSHTQILELNDHLLKFEAKNRNQRNAQMEILANRKFYSLYFDRNERSAPPKDVTDFAPNSSRLRDISTVYQDFTNQNKVFSDVFWSLHLGFGAGTAGFFGPMKQIIPLSTSSDFFMTVFRNSWGAGVRYSGQPLKTSPYLFNNFSFVLEKEFSSTRLRPWIQILPTYSSISYSPSENAEKTELSDGFVLTLRAGFSYLIFPQEFSMRLKLAAEGGRTFLKPFLGFSGRDNFWRFQLSLDLPLSLKGNVDTPKAFNQELSKQPAVFY